MKKLIGETAVVAALFTCLIYSALASDEICSHPWTVAVEDNGTASLRCECGDKVHGVVRCDSNTFQLQILQSYCMTHGDALGTTVGHCILNFFHLASILYTANNVSTLNDAMCGSFHRTDQMCGGCEKGYSPPVYSYSMACVECSDYKYHWLKFIVIALLPLTLFYIAVLIFRISALSPKLDVFILVCQLISAPGSMRVYGLYLPLMPLTFHRLTSLIFSLYGVWNLDFFRTVYTPFCLHPDLTSLQVLILDYAVAVYPLLLILVTYICVTLHDRYRVLVLLWGPFYRCLACIRREWHIRRSLVDAFATFLLLSYVKILNISIGLLTPTALYNVHGQKLHEYVLYFDGTVQYFSKDHIPYAILAILMLSIFNTVPIVVLSLYPCRCFQRCLNHFPCQLQALHIFMDAFQGSFKRSPYDCRYFAAVYLLLRALNLVTQTILQESLYYPFIGLIFFITSLTVSFVKPRRYFRHNLIDSLLLAGATIGVVLMFTNTASLYIDPIVTSNGNNPLIIACIIGTLPAIYWIILLVYSVTPKSIFDYFCKSCRSASCWKFCQAKEMFKFPEEGSEQSPLLNDHSN